MRGKDKTTAGILGILLGGLGIHHFYLGSTVTGIIEIVLTCVTCGFGALLGLVEGILLLVMDQNEFERALQPAGAGVGRVRLHEAEDDSTSDSSKSSGLLDCTLRRSAGCSPALRPRSTTACHGTHHRRGPAPRRHGPPGR